MTSPQQQYFITEEEVAIIEKILGYQSQTLHNVRSSPAPSPEEKPCDHCDFQERDEREDNIARQAAAQAREKVLKKVCSQCPIKNEEMPLEDYSAESCEGCLTRRVIESLRTWPHQPKRSHDLTQLQAKSDLQEPVKVPQYERD